MVAGGLEKPTLRQLGERGSGMGKAWMWLRRSGVGGCAWLALAAGCRSGGDIEAPVVTLVPAALQTTGQVTRDGERVLCLAPGAGAEAAIYVHEPTVRTTIAIRTSGSGPPAEMTLQVGDGAGVTAEVQSPIAEEFTYALGAAEGVQRMRIAVPARSAAAVCLERIAVTQP